MKACHNRKLSVSVKGSYTICTSAAERKSIYNACILILKRKERRLLLSLIKMALQ